MTLTPERETRLQEQARQAGLPLEEYALRVLDGTAAAPRTGAELVAQWEAEGAFLPDDDRPDSPELARQVREQAWNLGLVHSL